MADISKIRIKNAIRNIKDAVARRMIDELDAWIVQVLQNATATIDGIIARLTTAETKLSGIEDGAEVNDIDTVKVNGTALPITGKAVDISVPTYSDATQQTSGLMSAADKTKLDGVDSGADVNVIEDVKLNGSSLPVVNKAVNISDASQSASGLMSSQDKTKLDGVAAGADENVIEEVQVNGTALPVSGKSVNVTVPSYSDATPTTPGLMSASDKGKLDGIAAGATAVTVDAALSDTSENPVQNKVVKGALDGKANDADVVKTVNGIAPVQGGVTLPVDSAPASGSGNLISSDAVYQALMDAQTLLESIYLKLTGGTVTGPITCTYDGTGMGINAIAPSGAIGYLAKNSTTDRSVSMQVGSGGSNRGIYDSSGDKWMVYCDGNDALRFRGVTDATKGDLGIDDLENALGSAKFVYKQVSAGGSATYTFTSNCAYVILVSGPNASVRCTIYGYCTSSGSISNTKVDAGSSTNITLSTQTHKLTINNAYSSSTYAQLIRLAGTAPT